MPIMLTKLAQISLLFASTSRAAIPALTGYSVTWSDDFEGPQGQGVDTTKWNIAGPEDGKFNGEWQRYNNWNDDNTHLSGDGQLYIIPKRNSTGEFTSGRIESKSNFHCPLGSAMVVQSEFRVPDFTAGPVGPADGYWPAFWMLGASNRADPPVTWPYCGERDIFEGSPFQYANGTGALHWHDGVNKRLEKARTTYTGAQYHTWAFKVDRRDANTDLHAVTWYLDGTPFKTLTKVQLGSAGWTALAAKSFFIILNLAIGARYGWPGVTEDMNYTNWPSEHTLTGFVNSMRIKYVAVYHST